MAIRVCAFSKNIAPFLVAVAEDGSVPFAAVNTLVPNFVGLTFCNSKGYLQGLACDGDSIHPPHHGWQCNENYYAVVGPDNAAMVHQNSFLSADAENNAMKVEPVVHNSTSPLIGAPPWVDVPSVGAELHENNENNAGPGLNSISPVFCAPPWVNVAGVQGHCDGVTPDRDPFLNWKKHCERKMIDDETEQPRACNGGVADKNRESAEGDDNGACENADDDNKDKNGCVDDNDDGAVGKFKGIETHMLRFSRFPKKNAHDYELKKYMNQFGELLHCRIRRKFGLRGHSTGVADVLFRDLDAQESALKAQHMFMNQKCSLAKKQLNDPHDENGPTVIHMTRLPEGTTAAELMEDILAGYPGIKEVFIYNFGRKGYVDFETHLHALQLVKNKHQLEVRLGPVRVQFAKSYKGWIGKESLGWRQKPPRKKRVKGKGKKSLTR